MIKRGRPKGYIPFHIQVELTWKCNWRCVHCYQDSHNVEFLTKEVLLNLFEELSQSGCIHIILTGGEPLVRKDIIDLLNKIRELGMSTTLYSNGHLIDKEMASKLSSRVAQVELSLLGGNETIHDKLSKVKGSFNRTVSAIKNLKEYNVETVVKTPLLKPALKSMHNLHDLLKELEIEWLVDTNISESYDGNNYPLEYQLNDSELISFYETFPQFMPESFSSLDPGVKDGMCLAGRQFAFIDALGNVYPCLSFKGPNELTIINQNRVNVKMGNIFSQRFIDIWKHSIIADEIRKVSRKDFKSCQNCSSEHACSPCMAENHKFHNSIYEPAPSSCRDISLNI